MLENIIFIVDNLREQLKLNSRIEREYSHEF